MTESPTGRLHRDRDQLKPQCSYFYILHLQCCIDCIADYQKKFTWDTYLVDVSNIPAPYELFTSVGFFMLCKCEVCGFLSQNVIITIKQVTFTWAEIYCVKW